MFRGLQMLNGWDAIPTEAQAMRPKWRSAATPSRAAAADAAGKTLAQFPWLAETRAGLELYGFDTEFIERALAERAALAPEPAPPAPPDPPFTATVEE